MLSNYKTKKFKFYLKLPLIRQFVNSTFFGNLGEFVMPFILKKNLKVTYVEGFSITVIERFLDLSLISLIFGICLFFNDLNIYKNLINLYFLIFFISIFLTLYVMRTKNTFLTKIKLIKYFQRGFYKSFIRNKHLLNIVLLTILIWVFFIIIDLLIFNAFEVTKKISSLPNVIFITGVIILSQFIPAAPSSIGIFNYLVIEAINQFYIINNLAFSLQTQAELTSISMIILLIYILPDITWGGYLFFKEAALNLKNLKFIKLSK